MVTHNLYHSFDVEGWSDYKFRSGWIGFGRKKKIEERTDGESYDDGLCDVCETICFGSIILSKCMFLLVVSCDGVFPSCGNGVF